MTRIFLIGYMGAGKTTLGKALARAAGLSFVDLDWYIEERMHQSVRELFAERGEDGFRQLERKLLHEAGAFENVVVSAGGGTPCFFDNMDFMNRAGTTVWLDAGIDILFRRLKVAKRQRPLLADKTDDQLLRFIADALEQRRPYYAQARHRFAADELEDRRQIQQSVDRLQRQLGLAGLPHNES